MPAQEGVEVPCRPPPKPLLLACAESSPGLIREECGHGSGVVRGWAHHALARARGAAGHEIWHVQLQPSSSRDP